MPANVSLCMPIAEIMVTCVKTAVPFYSQPNFLSIIAMNLARV
jgi:hypothetical protein